MEALSVDLDRSLVDRTLNIPYSKSLVAQAARRLHRDPLTVHLMQALLSDVIAGSPGGPLLGETIIAALVHRLHAAARAPAAEQHGRLSRSEMNLVREYIDANLSGPLHLDALADLTGMSTPSLLPRVPEHDGLVTASARSPLPGGACPKMFE